MDYPSAHPDLTLWISNENPQHIIPLLSDIPRGMHSIRVQCGVTPNLHDKGSGFRLIFLSLTIPGR